MSSLKTFITTTLALSLSILAFASEPLPKPTDGAITKNGYTSRTATNVATYDIPISNYPSSITINLRGGDGGFAQTGRDSNPTFKASKGGGGIEGTATFNIHPTNAGALRPGGQIRLIPGNKGYDRQSGLYARAASGGGGGSGVLYHGPLTSDDWRPLIIAGGGGGAYASSVATKAVENRHGGAGQSSESGQTGSSTRYAGGTTGSGGSSGNLLGGGGGGWATNGDSGGGKGYPAGGSGGAVNINTNKGSAGGFGCGGGGDGGKLTSANTNQMSGGGGGGYSGGGGGAHQYGGGGGGSFVATGQTIGGIQLPTAEPNANRWTPRAAGLKKHGYVTIQTAGELLSEALPTITAADATIDFSSTDPYVDTGVVAQDIYGRSINYTITSNNVNRAVSGIYQVSYEATDQYGQKAEHARTITVRPGSYRPTFSLPSAYNITQSGQQTQLVATNFSANWFGDGDSYESLVRYEIRENSNPSLLSGDPTIANNGKINITPSGIAPGVTTLTIVAIDNGPDPTVRKSLPKTIDLRINLAPSAGQFLVSSNPDVFATSINFSEDSSSLVVGTVKSIDPDNQADLTYHLTGTDSSKFTLGLTDGVLRFKSQPNYETPNDNGGNRIYDLRIVTQDPSSATSASSSIISDLTVHLIDVNEPPSEPSLSNNSIPENTTEVGILSSTDPDTTNNVVSYQVADYPSSDGNLFKITTVNNQHRLEFKSAPDFEDAQDYGNDNSYIVSVIASSNGQSDSKLFTIYVTNVEEVLTTPILTLTSDPVLENQTTIGTVSSTDSDGTPVTYAVEENQGTDWQRISINTNTGTLTFNNAPDYENPDDFDANGVYDINVTATSGPDSITQSFSITLESVNEAPSTPVLADGSDTNIVENQTSVGYIESTDPENTAVTYSISDIFGDDSDKFEIHPTSGLLSMKTAPNFESPGYEGEVPGYIVCVVATSGDLSSQQFFTILVTDANDPPNQIELDNLSVDENIGTVGFLTSLDEDGTTVTFELPENANTDNGNFELYNDVGGKGLLVFKSNPNYEQPTDLDQNNVYEVTILATSDGDTISRTFDITVNNKPDGTKAPTLDNNTIVENTRFVGTVNAIDEDDELRYSIVVDEDDDFLDGALFEIDAVSGALNFLSAPNYESPLGRNADNTYQVHVKATPLSGNGGNDTTFTISVSDSKNNTIQEYRSEYNLAEDGSDDWTDNSGDGMPNIGYLMLGLGNPNSPTMLPATENHPGHPNVQRPENDPLVIKLAYSIHKNSYVDVFPEVSENLRDWVRPTYTTEPEPIRIITSSINSEYNLITIEYLYSSGNYGPFTGLPFSKQVFLRMVIQPD